MRQAALWIVTFAVACGGQRSSEAPADAAPPLLPETQTETETETDPVIPLTITASLAPIPDNTIGAIAKVIAPIGSSVTVEYGDDDKYGMVTKPSVVSSSGTVSFALLGLLPNSKAHVRARAELGGKTATTNDLVFDTGALPFELPTSFGVIKTSAGLGGFYFLGLARPAMRQLIDVVVDRSGRIRWYHVVNNSGPAVQPSHFERVRDNFLVYDFVASAFHERDPFGRTVRTWRDPASHMGVVRRGRRSRARHRLGGARRRLATVLPQGGGDRQAARQHDRRGR